jgi:transposase
VVAGRLREFERGGHLDADPYAVIEYMAEDLARTGSPWRDLPPFFGKWNSVWKRFRRWAKAGIWERILAALADDPDFESIIIDGTIIRAHQHAAGGKGGFTSKRSGDRVED